MDGCGKISIIIPAFNAEKSISGCIESIICQTYCNLQIIIVDDGSSDGTLSVCSKYAAEDDRITVIGQPNAGPSAARNAALKVADGDYLMFADADDRLSDNEACSFLVGTLEESGADAMFYSAAVYENGACVGRVTAGEDEVVCADGVIDGIISDDSSFGGGYPWNKLWKISGEVCQFDADLFAYEDKKWVLEQLQSCQKVYLGKRVCYNYYRSGHSLSRDVAREARRLKSIVAAGLLLALFMSNAGGLWDNSKKYVEAGNEGGKGSEAHKAAVVGDTVGDPFKDTAGPSINTQITVVSLVASLLAPLFVALSIF